MIFVVHEEDPFEHSSWYMNWNVRAEAHGINGEAVHVFPDVEAGTAPSFLIKLSIELWYHFIYLLMELFNFWINPFVVLEVVLSPVKFEHDFHEEVVDCDFILAKVL